MYVCVCHGVTDRAIAQAAQEGACSLGELAQSLRVATCCGKCAELAQSLLKAADQATPEAPAWLAGVT
ncbi:MAG TPA: bacterioferritin [Porticoccaceae bacterium]|uniref:(2Fe-2S)-binding protein n=1 Tax=Immundisolibacter sp. TaxID=1934948 RepID=UPI000E9925E9|nr:bacterioferritin [Porticoccaceae bacterium]HCO43254.1 bacterioferritin [Gammaproteobacteria bacterium]